MESIQNNISKTLELLGLSLVTLQLAILAWFLEIFDDATGLMVIHQFLILVVQLQQRVMALMDQDSDLVDIEPEDELPRGHCQYRRNHPRIADYTSDDQAMMETNFRLRELTILLHFFQLEQAADMDGFIRIDDYKFTADEILLFVLTKLKSGNSNTKNCASEIFGGDARHWSPALRWFYNRVQPMIQNHVSLQLLQSHRLHFPLFARQIATRIRSGFEVENPITRVMEFVPGIEYDNDEDPFRVFGFVDCSLFETSTPGTGPSGRYTGV